MHNAPGACSKYAAGAVYQKMLLEYIEPKILTQEQLFPEHLLLEHNLTKQGVVDMICLKGSTHLSKILGKPVGLPKILKNHRTNWNL